MLRVVVLSSLLVGMAGCGDDGSPDSGGRPQDGGAGSGLDAEGPEGGGSGGSAGNADSGADGGSPSDRSGCKRGVAYGHHSKADLQALSGAVSWWYNWGFVPDDDVKSTYQQLGVEYVPMVWGEAFVDVPKVTAAIPPGGRTLLGFNEPNFFSQANLSAQQAAALWPSLEEIAEQRGLALASPAVNFCGGGCHDTDPVRYLQDFFAACPGCRVDVIAVHVYVGCTPEGPNRAKWLIEKVEGYKAAFSQPLWVTEFACHDAATMEEQKAFLEDAVTWLEGEPRVQRYAWFSGRADNMQNVDLLGADGALTVIGQAYVDLPQPEECIR